MPANSSSVLAAPDAVERAERLRAVVEQHYERLCQGIAILVSKTCGPLRRDEVSERIQEVLGETVEQALAHAANFDPARSGVAWLLGIASHRLKNRRRQQGRDRHRPQSDLGEPAWQEILAKLHAAPTDDPGDLLDLRQALERLDAAARQAVELRYLQGLDGEALAQALDVPSSGAARVRVYRALQALRAHFRRGDSEGTP